MYKITKLYNLFSKNISNKLITIFHDETIIFIFIYLIFFEYLINSYQLYYFQLMEIGLYVY